VHVWHLRLLTQPSLGPGSLFNKSAQWSEVPSLEDTIQTGLAAVEEEVMQGSPAWSAHDKALFLVEKANVCITLGLDAKAKAALKEATELTRFKYALSGALGKRTRFQEKSTSQLVVLAKSADDSEADGRQGNGETQAVPQALPLNNDTLLEDIEFSREEGTKDEPSKELPEELNGMLPDEQPQLKPLDQIILLTEATLKDAFSPTDTLTSEEIMPFAVRVVSDKSTNWQIYTQALLVRSRIEVHRSRTIERGVLQMQAVVDQVVVDTTAPTSVSSEPTAEEDERNGHTVPSIEVSGPDENDKPATKTAQPSQKQATSFFPAAKPTESAPAHVRLEYIHALSSPPRWHLESELAYCWAGVGSLISALEIFKRLRLWAEVALCLASSAATEDEDGRGSGGEEKAKALLRWRLFRRTNQASAAPEPTDDLDEADIDVEELRSADYTGAERDPPPPNAPRLFCILGDIENEPKHYERAWDISKRRYARAQKSLGEYYLQHKEWNEAREAYRKAVAVNRMNPELWNRFGDINLRLGDFAEAAEAFRRAIASADNIVGGEEARTWSNLGSALYSLYVEEMKEMKKQNEAEEKSEEKPIQPTVPDQQEDNDEESSEELFPEESKKKRHPSVLLSQSLAAYKRGASIANDNWQIWDNVITLAARVRPVPVSDILLALRNIIRIRGGEESLDIDVLRLLLNEAVLSKQKPKTTELPRGTEERAVCDLLETAIVPLITARSDLWELIARERVWRRDYAGAVDAAERAWRAAVGGAGAGLAVSAATSGDGQVNWIVDKEGWKGVVERTDELVSALENYGPEIPEIGAKWKSKARSAIRSVMGKAKENWEGSEEWETLKGLLDGLR
jgi:tetratricopeptide (TPR) repeat protein